MTSLGTIVRNMNTHIRLNKVRKIMTMKLESKKDIVDLISQIKRYINGGDIEDADLKQFMESDNSMVHVFERAMELMGKDGFFNMVEIVDPENSPMWKEFYDVYTEMVNDFEEGEKEESGEG